MEASPGPNKTSLGTETASVGTDGSDVGTDLMLIGAKSKFISTNPRASLSISMLMTSMVIADD